METRNFAKAWAAMTNFQKPRNNCPTWSACVGISNWNLGGIWAAAAGGQCDTSPRMEKIFDRIEIQIFVFLYSRLDLSVNCLQNYLSTTFLSIPFLFKATAAVFKQQVEERAHANNLIRCNFQIIPLLCQIIRRI